MIDIFFFYGAVKEKRKTKEFAKFYSENRRFMQNKLFYAKSDNLLSRRRSHLLEKRAVRNLYIWSDR
jgi:hypothetical protein